MKPVTNNFENNFMLLSQKCSFLFIAFIPYTYVYLIIMLQQVIIFCNGAYERRKNIKYKFLIYGI